MRISKFLTAGLALFAGSAQAAVTAGQLVDTINSCTQVSGEILTQASGITLLNGLSVTASVVAGFGRIVTIITVAIVKVPGTKPFTDAKAEDAIVTALIAFVRVHQQLLNVVIGKKGILSRLNLTRGIAVILRQIEGVVDSIAFAIISLVPNRTKDCQAQKAAIDGTLKQAIETFA